MPDQNQNRILPWLKEYIALILIVVGLVASWVRNEAMIEQINARVDVLEVKGGQASTAQNQMLIQLAQIQVDVQWIKMQLLND